MLSAENTRDRRISHRFPLRLAAIYRCIGSQFASNLSTSKSLNISSAGLLFATTETLRWGQAVEVSIAWPVRLDNGTALELVIRGSIVRSTGDDAAMRLERYQFKTRSAVEA